MRPAVRIDPHEKIAGLPAVAVRDFLRRSDNFTATDLAQTFKLTLAEAQRVARELQAVGLIEPSKDERDDEDTFLMTAKGGRLRSASAARALTRRSAEQILDQFLERVHAVNGERSYAFRVRRVLLFGSMLDGGQERVSDVDIAVELEPREQEPTRQRELQDSRIREARRRGRTFSNYVEELVWPRREVLLCLKARSRGLSLHEARDLTFLGEIRTSTLFDASSDRAAGKGPQR
jgi:predicted nucleotidyltransferase